MNGVRFSGKDILSRDFISIDFDPGAASGLSGSYQKLMNEADFGREADTTIRIGDGQLILGLPYEIQIWFLDKRESSTDRVMTYSSGGETAATIDLDGRVGQFATGTFIADGTSQTLRLRTNGFDNVQLNAYQLRLLPPFIEVTTLEDELDSPAGSETSLREALRDAQTGDAIVFDDSLDGGTIQLDATLGQLRIEKSLNINASDLPNGITIDGGSNGDFTHDSNETRCVIIRDVGDQVVLDVSLNHLTIRDGSPAGGLGANLNNRENLTLIDCQILDGRSVLAGSHGGGIANVGGNIDLLRCTISGNKTGGNQDEGGGIYSQGGALTLINSTISDNGTEGNFAAGGGISSNEGILTMNDCTISGNRTLRVGGDGGGIFHEDGDLTLTNCTLSNNETQTAASCGAGIYLETNSTNDTVQLFRCTISENVAHNAAGGGIFNDQGSCLIEHCTIAGNTAVDGTGAGVTSNGRADTNTFLSQSIVRDNGTGLDLGLAGSINSFSFVGQNIVGSIDPNITGITLNSEPILLAELANYGGLTESMPPLAGSPAIEAATSSSSLFDQRGFPVIDFPDAGATESAIIRVTTLNDELDANAFEGEGRSLRESLRDARLGANILFDSALNGGQIQLDANLGELVIDNSLSIDASNLPNGIIIDGGSDGDFALDANETRCFFISDGNDNSHLEVELTNLTIQDGVFFGQIEGANIDNHENLTLTECRVLNGRGFFGAGINCIVRDTSLTLTGCTISGNQVSSQGGGIRCDRVFLSASHCTFSENKALGQTSAGGGIMFFGDGTTQSAFLTRCTFVGNESENGGGGYQSFNGRTEIEHCTFVDNSAPEGAGVFIGEDSSTSAHISNSIIRDSVGGSDLHLGATSNNIITFTGKNFIGTTSESFATITGLTPDTSPLLLAPFGDYGGPTETMPPLIGSPAINAAIGSTNTSGDQRGFLIFGIPDVGAAEFQDPDGLLSDNDNDGLVLILELAIGTDPNVADFDAAGRPQIGTDTNGDIALTFGRGSDFLPGTILLVERSNTLEADSFEEVYRFEFDNATGTVSLDSGLSADEQVDQFLITDQSAFEKAFYRLSVSLSQ